MKKKIFTLFTLLLCAVVGSWAQTETLLDYTTPSTDPETGEKSGTTGKVDIGVSGKYSSVTVSSVTYYGIKLDGENDAEGKKWVKAIPTKSLQVGDIITIKGWATSNSTSGEYGFDLYKAVGGTLSHTLPITGGKNTILDATYTIAEGSALIGASSFYICRKSEKSTIFNAITISRPDTKTATAEALKSSAAVKVDDTALTKDAVANGYSVEGTTITLSDDVTSLAAPENVELVKTITYDDSSTEDEDVAVTFDGTVTSGYYIGSASIGFSGSEIAYTVRVKKDVTPTLIASASSISLSSNRVLGTKKSITLTGMNLTGEASVALAGSVSGLTVSPSTFTVTEGAVDQEFVISYQSDDDVDEASVNLTFAVGANSVVVPITYSSTAAIELSSISTAKTWDFSKLTSNDVDEGRYGDAGVKLSAETSPSQSDDVAYENYNGQDITIASGFDGTTLAFAGQYPSRNKTMCQNGTLHFKTTVPGTITVNFSDTGSSVSASAKKRYLNINGSNTTYWTSRPTSGSTKSNDQKTTDAIEVPAGDVYVTGMEEDGTTPIAICVYTLTFTPATETTTITAAKYATFVPTMKVAVPAGVTASVIKSTTSTEATLTNVTVIPAGTPVVIYKDVDAATEVTFTATDADASDVAGNLLKASATDVTADGTHYILANGASGVGFYKATPSTTIAAGKAYLISPSGAPFFLFGFGGETTGINAAKAEGVKTGEAVYNLNGQRVSQPTKGLYIINGKKVVMK